MQPKLALCKAPECDCQDSIKNNDEEGVDCGGLCPERCPQKPARRLPPLPLFQGFDSWAANPKPQGNAARDLGMGFQTDIGWFALFRTVCSHLAACLPACTARTVAAVHLTAFLTACPGWSRSR